MASKKSSKSKAPKVAYAVGDGIGPEIMGEVLDILKAAGANLDLQEVVVGKQAYEAGEKNGISDADFKKLEKCRAFLKSPLETPQGKGYSSVNVAIRKRFDLFANVRPSRSFEPVVASKSGGSKKADIVIVRENLEDLYAGIEHRPTPDVAVGRKVMTKSEAERVIRAAFEYAKTNGRQTVTAISKDNIQKFTDGTNFHGVFDQVAEDYPEITSEFYIADIGIARTGARTGDFDVVVTQNMYGDIASDVVGEALGSIGLNGSANIGEKFAMFEAVHGTAPDIAGKGIGNPSGLLMASVMMLNYLGQGEVAEKVHNAWLKTLEDGIHTGDVYVEGTSKKRVGSVEFAEAVKNNLGQKPLVLESADYSSNAGGFNMPAPKLPREVDNFVTTGVDVHVVYNGSVDDLAKTVRPLLKGTGAKLAEIQTVRGDKVWPEKRDYFHSDYMTLRIEFDNAMNKTEEEKQQQTVGILSAFSGASGLKWREVRTLTVNPATMENNFR